MAKLFNFSHLKGDLFGGITAGIVALPLALAFGVSSGLGPTAGLYGAIFLSFFAALFGGTNTQISGPTAPMTAVSMGVIASIIATFEGDVSKALPVILTVFMLVGVLQIAFGALGLGKYIKYIPYPVVSGFMTAIGVIIITTQIIPALGYYPKEDSQYVAQFKPQAEEVIFEKILREEAGENIYVIDNVQQTLERAKNTSSEEIEMESRTLAGKAAGGVLGSVRIFHRAIQNINWLELMLATGTILIIYGFKKITTAVPSTLIALLLMSCIAIFGKLNYRPIDQIPQGFPAPILSIFTDFHLATILPYLATAVSLAFLGCIDSLLTSVVADNMTKTRHNPNRELFGQGVGNTLAAVFGGLPGAGATIRTVINIKSGGKTRLSGMIAGVLVMVILLVLAPIASKIPAAVLAGILITVGIGVMDYKGLKAIRTMPRTEVFIMLIVLILSAFWNLVYAVGIGLVLAAIIFMKKLGDITSAESEISPLKEKESWTDEFDFPETLKQEVFIKRLNGPIFFGYSTDFQDLSSQIPDSSHTVVFRMSRVPYIDQSGFYAIDEVLKRLIGNGKTILISGLREQPREMLKKHALIPGLIPHAQIFPDFKSCLEWLQLNVEKADA